MGYARTGRRRWTGAAVVVVLVLIGYGVARALTAEPAAKPAAPPAVAADRGEVSTEVATTGTVQPAQTRSLSFAVAGTVDNVAVAPGTMVTPGQRVATVDDTDAAAAVTNARTALDQAQDALAEAESEADDAAGCPATASAGPAATPGPRASAPGDRCATARPQQGAGGDPILGARQRVTQATTALQQAEDTLSGTTITAPMAGRILTVAGKVGSQVGAGSAFVTLADVNDMRIDADFPEADADRLASGQHAVVTLADRSGQQFEATVVQVDPVGTSDGTMVRYGAVLAFRKAPDALLVGQSAAVRVTTGVKTGVLRVPSTAVHDVAGSAATVQRNGVATKVLIGLRGDRYTEVTSGLAEGDTVARSW